MGKVYTCKKWVVYQCRAPYAVNGQEPPVHIRSHRMCLNRLRNIRIYSSKPKTTENKPFN